jgi:hypothetical protein
MHAVPKPYLPGDRMPFISVMMDGSGPPTKPPYIQSQTVYRRSPTRRWMALLALVGRYGLIIRDLNPFQPFLITGLTVVRLVRRISV